MMKHAYLIIVHHEFDILKLLIAALDHYQNDIYIHFDRKILHCPALHTRHAGLFFTQERVDVRWADISQIAAEMVLFETAFVTGGYSYYHLLSGVDMPLKCQAEIHGFFDQHAGKEFIGYNHLVSAKEMERKVMRYHLFPRHFRSTASPLNACRKAIRYLALRLQFILDIKKNKGVDFKKGTSWCSVTHDFVAHVLENKQDVMRRYAYSFCADEIFLHTLCWNSTFRKNLFDASEEGRGSLREICWKNNKLVDWTAADYDFLMQSEALFARKFNDKEISLAQRILRQLGKPDQPALQP
jgi:hypothetical protein